MCWANEQEEAFHFRNSEGEAMQCSSVRPSDGPDDSFVLCDASKLVFGLRFEAQGKLPRITKPPTEWLRRGARDKDVPRSDRLCIGGLVMKNDIAVLRLAGGEDGEIYFFDRIWIPSVGGVRKLIMDEAHTSRYSIHPGADKMYHDLRDLYWWPGMKNPIGQSTLELSARS
ncbi:putative reverse transcriptase domain-containing protein [Tanacetum coccineum]